MSLGKHAGLSVAALRALREAATLASVARDVRLRIGDGRRTVVEVRRPPFCADDGVLMVPPCRFRAAVAAAHAQHIAGQAVVMAGLEHVTDPTVRIGLGPSDVLLPGGIYRLFSDDEWTLLFATYLELGAAMSACSEMEQATVAPCGHVLTDRHVRIGFHYDELTAITLVHTAVRDHGPATLDHLDAMQRALARCVVDELANELDQTMRRS
jgi:hypothetical protein